MILAIVSINNYKTSCDMWSRDMDCDNKIEKNVNDMGEKDIEENIWTNRGEWTVQN
jgi:hypothetical protein